MAAVLEEMTIVAPDVAPEMITTADIKTAIARQFWAYFYLHQDDKLISRKVLFWTVSIHLRDLYPLFVKLFGLPDGAEF